jgi:hypothetical protein
VAGVAVLLWRDARMLYHQAVAVMRNPARWILVLVWLALATYGVRSSVGGTAYFLGFLRGFGPALGAFAVAAVAGLALAGPAAPAVFVEPADATLLAASRISWRGLLVWRFVRSVLQFWRILIAFWFVVLLPGPAASGRAALLVGVLAVTVGAEGLRGIAFVARRTLGAAGYAAAVAATLLGLFGNPASVLFRGVAQGRSALASLLAALAAWPLGRHGLFAGWAHLVLSPTLSGALSLSVWALIPWVALLALSPPLVPEALVRLAQSAAMRQRRSSAEGWGILTGGPPAARRVVSTRPGARPLLRGPWTLAWAEALPSLTPLGVARMAGGLAGAVLAGDLAHQIRLPVLVVLAGMVYVTVLLGGTTAARRYARLTLPMVLAVPGSGAAKLAAYIAPAVVQMAVFWAVVLAMADGTGRDVPILVLCALGGQFVLTAVRCLAWVAYPNAWEQRVLLPWLLLLSSIVVLVPPAAVAALAAGLGTGLPVAAAAGGAVALAEGYGVLSLAGVRWQRGIERRLWDGAAA